MRIAYLLPTIILFTGTVLGQSKKDQIDILIKQNDSLKQVIVAHEATIKMQETEIAAYEIQTQQLQDLSTKQEQNALELKAKNAQLTNELDGLAKELQKSNLYFEDLLNFSSEKALIEFFGAANVKTEYSTEGPEGTEVEGYYYSVLYPETRKEVVFYWSEGKVGIDRILLNTQNSVWETRDGVYLGIPLEELVRINKKHFTFLGFGWDYSGATNFSEGYLSSKGFYGALSDVAGSEELMGDQEISSNSESVQYVTIVLAELILVPADKR